MGRFARIILGVLLAGVLSMFLPRDIGRELRLVAAWTHRPEAVGSSALDAAIDRDSLSDLMVLVAGTRWSAVRARDGRALRSGVRTAHFTASTDGYVNQPDVARSWAVQGWDGSVLGIVPRQGLPVLEDSVLAQFTADGVLAATDIARGARTQVRMPAEPSVYALDAREGGAPLVAVGSVHGELAVARAGDAWTHRFRHRRFTEASSAIYAIDILPSSSRDLLILHGRNPQQLSRVVLGAAGEVRAELVTSLEGSEQVAWPTNIDASDPDLLAVGLNRSVLIIDRESGTLRRVPIPGSDILWGTRDGPVGTVMVGAGSDRESILVLVSADFSPLATWRFTGSGIAALPPDRGQAMMVLELDDGGFIALEARL